MSAPGPTSEQCFAVADRFRGLLDGKWGPICPKLDMGVTGVHETDCGTVACHGGWYSFAKRGPEEMVTPFGAGKPHRCSSSGRLPFEDGAILMAHDLGFGDAGHREDDHPFDAAWRLNAWVRDSGLFGPPGSSFLNIFTDNEAFVWRGKKATLTDVEAAWRHLGQKLRAREEWARRTPRP